MITIAEVRSTLGEAYSTKPDDAIIQSFIDRRTEELKDLIGLDDLSSPPHQSLLKRWLLNKVCCDVLANDLLGVDSADVLEYSIGELRESRSKNVDLKLTWYQSFKEAADLALNTYFLKTRSYRAVRL
jgi:hypothetical protein